MPLKIPPHLKQRFLELDRLPTISVLPEPWSIRTIVAVGGLTDVGFADGSDLLVCMSSAGLGVFDCLTGTRVARDNSADCNFDAGNLLVSGIGPLEGQRIRTAGLEGGGLASGTYDGWSIERHPFAYPDEELFLGPPGQTMLWTQHGIQTRLYKLGGFVTALRAFGFSPTGRSLIVATSSDLLIFARTP